MTARTQAPRPSRWLLGLALAAATASSGATAALDDAPNFEDHVKPILRESCLDCHRGSRARNGLDLSSTAKILAGGSSGAAVVPGDPDGSLLMLVVDHAQGPFMPPDDDRLPDAQRATLRAWIAGGARVDASDPGAEPSRADTAVLPVATAGAATMPGAGLSIEPVTWTDRPGPVTAVAVSPGAPLLAVGGFGQVSLYALPPAAEGEGPAAGELLAVLPFPAGRPERLSFASSGGVLLAAGGRAGERGVAVGYDVRSGELLFEVGDEPETVLDADVTGDLAVVVLGGPDRVLRAYDPATGAGRWECKAHTDWVTAVAVSPGGALVASGDRAGGLVVLETFTGREFHRPEPSRGAVTGLAWRADGARLAVADEAGTVRVFDAEGGGQVARWSAHGGALDVAWLSDGGVVTVGRDGGVRVTDGAGKARPASTKLETATVAVAASSTGAWVAAGDLAGHVHLLPVEDSGRTLSLAAYPPPAALRELRAAEADAAEHAAALAVANAARAAAQESLAATTESLERASEQAADADARDDGARRRLDSATTLQQTAHACVALLEDARAAARALAAQDPDGGGFDPTPWDALADGARREAERCAALVETVRESRAALRSEVEAAQSDLATASAARDALERERTDLAAEADAAAEALRNADSRVDELRARWNAARTDSGTWRRSSR